MKLYRSLLPTTFLANFVRVTDHQLCQLKAVRWFMGGVWVKESGTWAQVEVLREADDGELLVLMCSHDNSWNVSFWSTNAAVSDLEDYR